MPFIQFVAIVINFFFLMYTSSLIIKGKLKEEYAIVWWVFAGLLLLFSIWSEGLYTLAHLLDVVTPVNLVFSIIIFIILIYLLHLSLTNSKLQQNVTNLTQEIALLKEQLASDKQQTDADSNEEKKE